jgi:hypothetical protein
MTEKIETTRMQDKTVIDEWRTENAVLITTHSKSNMECIIAERTHFISKFNLHSGKRAFGAEASRVETVCIIIQCAAQRRMKNILRHCSRPSIPTKNALLECLYLAAFTSWKVRKSYATYSGGTISI